MPFKQDEAFKALISSIGKMIDARFETFSINLRSEMHDEFRKIRGEMATKDDIKRLEEKIDKRDKQYEERFEAIETVLSMTPRKN